jgi:predicted GNAT superfamily acetyltransferase
VTPKAEQAAATAAEHAGVRVRTIAERREADAVADIFTRVWQRAEISADFTWALAYAGNYVALAEADATVVGAALAFRGHDDEGPLVHSHITGVLPELQGRSVGYALKLHQRAWTLAAGLDRLTWTFDPLVARNAYFNVTKLGAELVRFHPDFYGPLPDGINAGDETDRCVVSWRLSSERSLAALAGTLAPPDVARLRDEGAHVVLSRGPDDEPKLTPEEAPTLLCHLPSDAVALRAERPEVAMAWRRALRAVLDPAFANGYRVVGVSRDSWYVLTRDE